MSLPIFTKASDSYRFIGFQVTSSLDNNPNWLRAYEEKNLRK